MDAPILDERKRWVARAAFTLVVLCAVVMAVVVYARFLDDHRYLWNSVSHDRNAHYLTGSRMALHMENGQLHKVAAEIYRSRVWGPINSVLVAGVLVVGGHDYRLAVLPSLVGWVGTALFAFLLVRRIVPRHGNIFGCLASFFVLVSPGYQGYATDIMYESLGACFSFGVLYAYVVAVQQETPSKWPGRWLGLGLTLMFFFKMNYWLLVVFAIVGNELLCRFGLYPRAVADRVREVDWSAWAGRQVRNPAAWLLVLLPSAAVALFLRGKPTLNVFGAEARVYPPMFLIEWTYVVAFLVVLRWWWVSGHSWLETFDRRYRQVIAWHIWPVAIKFLLPKHLGYFLWFVSPANTPNAKPHSILIGAKFHLRHIIDNYHVGFSSVVLVGCLIGLALVGLRRLKAGGLTLGIFFVVSAILTARHPNMQPRYMHSWLAMGWVLAAIGLAVSLPNAVSLRWPRASMAGAGLACLAVMAWHVPRAFPVRLPQEGSITQTVVSDLDITDSYLSFLDESDKALILTTMPGRFFFEWTALERYGEDRLEHRWHGFGNSPEANRDKFRGWLGSTECDTIVFVDETPHGGTKSKFVEVQRHEQLREVLLSQKTFPLVHVREFPEQSCRVMVFRRPERFANR